MSASVLTVPRVPCVLLACVLIACCCSVAVGQIAVDCCLEVKNKDVPKAVVVDYLVQVGGQGCAIDAVILVTRAGRTLCVPPTQPRLTHILTHVDKCKNSGYKGKRCSRIRRL